MAIVIMDSKNKVRIDISQMKKVSRKVLAAPRKSQDDIFSRINMKPIREEKIKGRFHVLYRLPMGYCIL